MNPFESFDILLKLAPGFAVKFLAAVLCGGAIGMERERSGKPAGLRTTILVCLGGTLFTVISIEMARQFSGDATRIAAQIITGVGFLGAGAILHGSGRGIVGLTTAAIIWVTTALGMIIGAGYPITAVVLTAAIVLMILVLERLEGRIRNRTLRICTLMMDDTPETRRRVMAVLSLFDESVHNPSLVSDGHGGITLRFGLIGYSTQRREVLAELYAIEGVHVPTIGD